MYGRIAGVEDQGETTTLSAQDAMSLYTTIAASGIQCWVMGGWGGDIVGLSSIDGWDASDNEMR